MIKKLILFAAILAVNIFAAGNGDELLRSIKNKYDSVSDMSADFQKATNGKADFSGKIFFKKENKVRLELKNLTIVSDGKTNWNYNKKDNKVIISEYNDEDPSILSFNEVLFDYPEKCNIAFESENGTDILVLTPKQSSNLNFNKMKLWINPENLVSKVQINDPQNGIIELTISNYQLNKI